MSKKKETKKPLDAMDKFQILTELLRVEPDLTDKLIEGLQCQRFFITLTMQKKYKPDDKADMHHFFVHKGIELNDCLRSLRHINNDFIAKFVPMAKIAGNDSWH